jgi:aspartate/glutamate racemase
MKLLTPRNIALACKGKLVMGPKAKEADLDKFFAVVEHMKNKGCDRMILGCTELSVINRSIGGRKELTDSLEVLANVAIKLCGHETVGFSPEFDLI